MATREEKMEAFGQLLDILDELRVKCPWDRKQTNESLRTNTIEETYELCEALMREDNRNIKKELGDLLLHISPGVLGTDVIKFSREKEPAQ